MCELRKPLSADFEDQATDLTRNKDQGSGGLFREEGLQGSIAAHPRGDWCVQQVACKENRALSRDLLKLEDASPKRGPARDVRAGLRREKSLT